MGEVKEAMKMPPKGKSAEIPPGVYGPHSRLNGVDINGQIYQVGLSKHGKPKSYRENYDKIRWDK